MKTFIPPLIVLAGLVAGCNLGPASLPPPPGGAAATPTRPSPTTAEPTSPVKAKPTGPHIPITDP